MPRALTATLIVAVSSLWTTGMRLPSRGRSPAPSGTLLGRFYPVCSLRSRARAHRESSISDQRRQRPISHHQPARRHVRPRSH